MCIRDRYQRRVHGDYSAAKDDFSSLVIQKESKTFLLSCSFAIGLCYMEMKDYKNAKMKFLELEGNLINCKMWKNLLTIQNKLYYIYFIEGNKIDFEKYHEKILKSFENLKKYSHNKKDIFDSFIQIITTFIAVNDISTANDYCKQFLDFLEKKSVPSISGIAEYLTAITEYVENKRISELLAKEEDIITGDTSNLYFLIHFELSMIRILLKEREYKQCHAWCIKLLSHWEECYCENHAWYIKLLYHCKEHYWGKHPIYIEICPYITLCYLGLYDSSKNKQFVETAKKLFNPMKDKMKKIKEKNEKELKNIFIDPEIENQYNYLDSLFLFIDGEKEKDQIAENKYGNVGKKPEDPEPGDLDKKTKEEEKKTEEEEKKSEDEEKNSEEEEKKRLDEEKKRKEKKKREDAKRGEEEEKKRCLLYTSPSPRDLSTSRMPSSA
eukprot:TRINITY_DN58309_c0_g1_i1.p1 TRINITY_DN58309_c0_g1~~TRINITY_DN58309_c0_g1_i1.p1  ORF type:complete len:439 (+),score=134.36 TRINITY_DN58309_c0_g1_i1:150-1466(+)